VRKALFIAGLILVLAVVAVAFFVATFDADRYRPLAENRLSAALGNAVKLDRLRLGWHGGLALELQGLAVYAGDKPEGEPALALGSASAVLRVAPLLKKDIQVGSLFLTRPQLQLVRLADGRVFLRGFRSAETAGRVPKPPLAALSLLIRKVEIRDGEFRFTDFSERPSTDITLRDVDIELEDVSLASPLDIEARAAVAGSKQNLKVATRLLLPGPGRAGSMESLHASLDLAHVDPETLGREIPALEGIGLAGNLAGTLLLETGRLDFQNADVALLSSSIRLEGGRFTFDSIASPLENVSGEIRLQGSRFDVRGVSADFAGGSLSLSGSSEMAGAGVREVNFQFKAENIPLEVLAPPARGGEPRLQGIAALAFQGRLRGISSSQLIHSLAGEGRLLVMNGVLANFNLLRTVLERLSIVPGLEQTFMRRLPPASQAKLDDRDTVFSPIDLPLVASNGVIFSDAVRIATEGYSLSGRGRLSVDGIVDCPTSFAIDPELSAALIKSLRELSHLADPEGRLTLPVRIVGTLPDVEFLPDTQYVASKIIVTTAQELLGKFVGPGETTPHPEASPAAQPASQPPQGQYQDLLGAILQKALEKKK
jgi:hypothetical protein